MNPITECVVFRAALGLYTIKPNKHMETKCKLFGNLDHTLAPPSSDLREQLNTFNGALRNIFLLIIA